MSVQQGIALDDFANSLRVGRDLESPPHFFIALSGGLDSCVLLHLMVQLRSELGGQLCALHFDHGLQPASRDWAEFCQRLADGYGVDFLSHRANLSIDASQGIEASARKARYQWFAQTIAAATDDKTQAVLLTAHHADDQAETLLMNVLRGTGLSGLRGIARQQDRDNYQLRRPLLDWTREQLSEYAQHQGLEWIEDPSNTDQQFLRNRIRHTVMPALRAARADVAQQFVKAADHSAVASQLLQELADQDLRNIERLPYCPLDKSYALELAGFNGMSEHRIANALKSWLQEVGFPVNSRGDLQALVDWAMTGASEGAELGRRTRIYRHYRGCLYVMPNKPLDINLPLMQWLNPGEPILIQDLAVELVASNLSGPLTIAFRHNSPAIALPDRSGHIQLRKRFQDLGIPPWRRALAPIVLAGDRLVGIAGGADDDKLLFRVRDVVNT